MIKKLVLIFLPLVLFISVCSCTGLGRRSSGKDGQINISFWESEDAVVTPYMDRVIAKFEENNPGVKVSRNHYSVEDLHTQFQSASIAGSPPEIIFTASDRTGLFVATGLIMPLDDHFDFSVYVDSSIEAVTQDDKIWGVPNNYGNQLMLYYNKDYVQEPPKNTEELFKLCEQIIKNKNKSNPNRNMTCFEINQSEPFWLIPILTSFGGWPIEDGKPTLNTEAMIKSLEYIKNLREKRFISQECDYNCMDSMFKESNTAMIVNGDWTLGAYLEAMEGKMGVTVLPINSDTGKRMRPMVSGKYFYVSSFTRSDKMDTVKKFIEEFNSVDNQKVMTRELKKLSARKSIFDSKELNKDPLFSVMAKQINYGMPTPSEVEMRAVWDIVRQYQGLSLSGRMKPEIASRRMQEEVTKRIKEMKM